jgi:hypothetical protein
MRNRMPATAILATVLLAVVTAASGCASSPATNPPLPTGTVSHTPSSPSSPGRPSSPQPIAGAGGPNIPAVRLGTAFSPKTLDLGAGQQFVVIVSDGVKATGSGIDGACTAAAAARFASSMLSLRCDGSAYLYTTRRAGSSALSVTVRPSCAAGTVCPMWIAVATLTLKIT